MHDMLFVYVCVFVHHMLCECVCVYVCVFVHNMQLIIYYSEFHAHAIIR